MVAGARVRVERFRGDVTDFVRLTVSDNRGGRVSVILSVQEAVSLARDILSTVANIGVAVGQDVFKQKPSGWKRTTPKRIGWSARSRGGREYGRESSGFGEDSGGAGGESGSGEVREL